MSLSIKIYTRIPLFYNGIFTLLNIVYKLYYSFLLLRVRMFCPRLLQTIFFFFIESISLTRVFLHSVVVSQTIYIEESNYTFLCWYPFTFLFLFRFNRFILLLNFSFYFSSFSLFLLFLPFFYIILFTVTVLLSYPSWPWKVKWCLCD